MVVRAWLISGILVIGIAWSMTVSYSPSDYQGTSRSAIDAYREAGLMPAAGSLTLSKEIGHDVFEVPKTDADHVGDQSMMGMGGMSGMGEGKMPGMDMKNMPGMDMKAVPGGGAPAKMPGMAGDKMSGMDMKNMPGMKMKTMPGMDMKKMAGGGDPAKMPGMAGDKKSGMDMKNMPGMKMKTMPGMDMKKMAGGGDPAKMPGMTAEKMPGMDKMSMSGEGGQAKMPGMDKNKMPGMDMKKMAGGDTAKMPKMAAKKDHGDDETEKAEKGHGEEAEKEEEGHSGSGGGLEVLKAGSAPKVDRIVKIQMAEWGYKPGRVIVKPGETIRLVVTNAGNTPHEFMLMTPAAMGAVGYRVNRADWNLTEHKAIYEKPLVMPGDRFELVVKIEKPGMWMFMCMFPYHMRLGMMGGLMTEGMQGMSMGGMKM